MGKIGLKVGEEKVIFVEAKKIKSFELKNRHQDYKKLAEGSHLFERFQNLIEVVMSNKTVYYICNDPDEFYVDLNVAFAPFSRKKVKKLSVYSLNARQLVKFLPEDVLSKEETIHEIVVQHPVYRYKLKDGSIVDMPKDGTVGECFEVVQIERKRKRK